MGSMELRYSDDRCKSSPGPGGEIRRLCRKEEVVGVVEVSRRTS